MSHCIKFLFLFYVVYLKAHLLLQYFITVVCLNLTRIHSDFFLRWVHCKIKNSGQTINLSRQTVLDLSLRLISVFPQFDQ